MSSRLATLARSGGRAAASPTGGRLPPGGPAATATATPGGTAADDAEERCELCSEPLPPEHRHLLDLESRELLCACRACGLLFEGDAAGGDHYRLIGDRRLRLDGFALDDRLWDELRIPVEMAFFFHHGGAGRTLAHYPSPMGPTESLLELDAWSRIEAANPVLADMEADVEALLVDRRRGGRRHWLVPLDDCYRLVALIRTRWKGLAGGTEVWQAVDDFFEQLDKEAK